MRLTVNGDGRFVLVSSYEEREVPKRAGFRWDPQRRQWWTDRPETAARLAQHADESCKAALVTIQARQEASVAASRATDADVDIPCPEGLAYLPFQRAGIAFAAARAATLMGDEMELGRLVAIAETLTPHRIGAIHAALRCLAAVCDGARDLDGAGFSKIDARIGRELALCPALTPRQAALGLQLVTKYHRQLPADLLALAKDE